MILELLGILVLAAGIGALNGSLIAFSGLQPFIVTLATWSIWGGVAFAILAVEGGTPAPGLISACSGSVFGVPKSVGRRRLLFLLWCWLRPTRFITDLTAIGSDEDRARLLGVSVARRKIAGVRVLGRRSRPSPRSG